MGGKGKKKEEEEVKIREKGRRNIKKKRKEKRKNGPEIRSINRRTGRTKSSYDVCNYARTDECHGGRGCFCERSRSPIRNKLE